MAHLVIVGIIAFKSIGGGVDNQDVSAFTQHTHDYDFDRRLMGDRWEVELKVGFEVLSVDTD